MLIIKELNQLVRDGSNKQMLFQKQVQEGEQIFLEELFVVVLLQLQPLLVALE